MISRLTRLDSGFTILFLAPGFVARGDFDGRGRSRAVPQGLAVRAEIATAGALVTAALGLSTVRPRRVWILTTQASLLTVEFPEDKLRGLTEDERLSALAFEAEALTGTPAASAGLGARLTETSEAGEHWCLVQLAHRVRQEMETEVARKGGRIAGILHPGGLPVSLGAEGEAAQEWERREFWPETMVTVRGNSTDFPLEVEHWDEHRPVEDVLRARPSGKDFNPLRHACLLPPGVCPPIAGCGELLSLAQPKTLALWMDAWAQTLLAPDPKAAIIRSPQPPASPAQRAALSAGAAVATAVLCAGHWALTDWQLSRNTAELKVLAARNKHRDELQAAAGRVATLRSDLETARRRHRQELEGFSELLGALGEVRPEGLMVRSIRESGSQLHENSVTGLCSRPELAGQFANALAGRLEPLGWEVRPAAQKAELISGTPAWSFEITLRLAALTESPQPKERKP